MDYKEIGDIYIGNKKHILIQQDNKLKLVKSGYEVVLCHDLSRMAKKFESRECCEFDFKLCQWLEESSFEKFWDKYHKLTGLRKTDISEAKKYFNRLTLQERKRAIDNIEKYIASNDKRYYKKARTYLSHKNFDDEFKVKQTGGKWV